MLEFWLFLCLVFNITLISIKVQSFSRHKDEGRDGHMEKDREKSWRELRYEREGKSEKIDIQIHVCN